ncbi:MAG: helix-turn-helix domain-containing protein [Chitinispirillales bacterium]|jgi:cytoskeletal protein RodZ|nr:helix-turn-helix domain-containing protein [Chitinispirillales bacterium]
MAENNAENVSVPGSGDDKVGDVLKRERLTRRITIETIAKDLKLNPGYIKALEASDFNSLPPSPYVRVYIKSLTEYLSLDTESLMKQFYKERGMISDDYRNKSNKIDISVQKQEKSPAVVIAAVLIVVLAVFAFIANQRGWITQPGEFAMEMEGADTANILNQESLEAQSEDSLLADLNVPETTAAKVGKVPPRP